MKRTVEIDDSLQERLQDCKQETLDHLVEHFKEHPGDTFDNWYDDNFRHHGTDHETVDSNTPIYYSDIDGIFYLYGDELEEAYNNAGVYDQPPENFRQVCIYFWLDQNLHEWIHEALQGVWWEDVGSRLVDYYQCRRLLEPEIWEPMVALSTKSVDLT